MGGFRLPLTVFAHLQQLSARNVKAKDPKFLSNPISKLMEPIMEPIIIQSANGKRSTRLGIN
jgi:hypothetical protein